MWLAQNSDFHAENWTYTDLMIIVVIIKFIWREGTNYCTPLSNSLFRKYELKQLHWQFNLKFFSRFLSHSIAITATTNITSTPSMLLGNNKKNPTVVVCDVCNVAKWYVHMQENSIICKHVCIYGFSWGGGGFTAVLLLFMFPKLTVSFALLTLSHFILSHS